MDASTCEYSILFVSPFVDLVALVTSTLAVGLLVGYKVDHFSSKRGYFLTRGFSIKND